MKRRLAALLVLAAGLALAASASATQTTTGVRYARFTLASPVTLHIETDGSFDPAFLPGAKAAAAAWEQTGDYKFVWQTGPASCLNSPGAWALYTICLQTNAQYPGFLGWVTALGIWKISTVDGARLNSYAVITLAPWLAPSDSQWIDCHETGEVLGLRDHTDPPPADPPSSYDPTCLTSDAQDGKVQATPSSEDLATLHAWAQILEPAPASPPSMNGMGGHK